MQSDSLPPPELFLVICSYLSPANLITLSQVCRKFREYLCAPDSLTTQQIWKQSRLKFMKEDMPPPEGMSEEKYVKLLMVEQGCQICKQVKECKIYWEFEVRCCKKCFSKKTISRIMLTLNFYPSEFLHIMSYTYCYWKYYWIEQIELAYPQYHNLPKENVQSWLDDRRHILDSIMEYVKQRKSKEKEVKPDLKPFFTPHLLTISR